MKLSIRRRKFPCAKRKIGLVFTGISLTLLGVAGGCASTTYDIVEPSQSARRIAGDSDTVLEMKPLAYRFRSVEDHLVIRISNPGQEEIAVLGPDSYVVDPEGQSHGVVSQTIRPGAFVKMILPPLPPEQMPAGPYVSFEVSSGGVAMDNPMPRLDPQGLRSQSGDTWSWTGDGEVKLRLKYQLGNAEPFTHSFSIRRNKS